MVFFGLPEFETAVKKENTHLGEHIANEKFRKPVFTLDRRKENFQHQYQKFTVNSKKAHKGWAYNEIKKQNSKLADKISSQ